jgi:HK97 family phage major capsid protein
MKEKTMDYEVKADGIAAVFEGAQAAVTTERPELSGSSSTSAAREAFVGGYLRHGRDTELKSFNSIVAAEGGYALPREIDAVIDATLKSISPIRSIANVVQVGSAGYRKLVTKNGTVSGWSNETGPRAETGTPDFNEVVPSFGELYANPFVTQAMLDDAAFDVEGWLAGEIATEFARAEGVAFVNGDGVNKPKGFLTNATNAAKDDVRPFGTLQYLASGASGDFAPGTAQDRLIELVHALRAPYRQGAVWVMNSSTTARLRKLKTTDGVFIWQPGLSGGQADTLLGYPVIESEDMPDIAAGSLSIAFGNFKAGYLIAERAETAILRDPYTQKPFVSFYATKRLGGTVSNSEAIKLIKFAAS